MEWSDTLRTNIVSWQCLPWSMRENELFLMQHMCEVIVGRRTLNVLYAFNDCIVYMHGSPPKGDMKRPHSHRIYQIASNYSDSFYQCPDCTQAIVKGHDCDCRTCLLTEDFDSHKPVDWDVIYDNRQNKEPVWLTDPHAPHFMGGTFPEHECKNDYSDVPYTDMDELD